MEDWFLRTPNLVDTHHVGSTNFLPTLEHAVECCAAPERRGLLHLPFVADRKLLAPSGTAPCQDLTACLGRHTRPEPMGVLALPVVRLKRPLHILPSVLFNRGDKQSISR
jgi:hypothetical protein